VVNQSFAEQAGALGPAIVLVSPNGRRVPAEVIGVVEHPPLSLYEARAGPLVFLPWQKGSLVATSLLVDGGKSEVASIVSGVDSRVPALVQDYPSRMQEQWTLWRWMIGILWIAGVGGLSLAAAGKAAFLAQLFAEREHDVALRCALGARVREIRIWAARQAAPGVAVGTAIAIPVGVAAFLSASRFRSSSLLISASATILAGCALSMLWRGAAWFASARAAAGSLMDRLRHI
jgi:hypothetical protein